MHRSDTMAGSIWSTISTLISILILASTALNAQFTYQWLDIGEYQHRYLESGAPATSDRGMDYPAELRNSGQLWAQGSWIGVKNWTNERGEFFPFYVSQIGPRQSGEGFTFPIRNSIIARYEDTEVYVDGALSVEYTAAVEDIDPNLPADRIVHNIYNQIPGLTVNRKAYAYANEHFDNFHIVTNTYCNTGNLDGDEAIELDGQNLEDVFFFHYHHWRGNLQGAEEHPWGRYTLIDIVGDGHETYPVDFTAIFMWYGMDPNMTRFDDLGTPLFYEGDNRFAAPGDTVGRLSGIGFDGRVTLHANVSPADPSYVRCTQETESTCQPSQLFWMNADGHLASHSTSHQDSYELGILTRENPKYFPGGSTHGWPHYADRIEPAGDFWNGQNDPSNGKQGGNAATDAYGPYQMQFGECVTIDVADVVSGLSYDASVQVGRAFKDSGGDTELLIAYDANADGNIDETPFNYGMKPSEWGNNVFTGSERMTKNQWFMSQRDSLYKSMQRAVDIWEASSQMTRYPIPEPPRAPRRFEVSSRPERIDLSWEPNEGGPTISNWELYRTSKFDDNFLDPDGDGLHKFDDAGNLVTGYECVAGCPGTSPLPAGTTRYDDETPVRGRDYYYYLQAVGSEIARDPTGLNGSPSGLPLRSSRYLTQTFHPANLKRLPYGSSGTVSDARVVPNPVNLGSDESVRFAQENRVAFFNIPGYCTIKIFTEIGELVKVIEHSDGSGDETWNLTTEARQLLVSGIYIAVIEETDSGGSLSGGMTTLKFTVIR